MRTARGTTYPLWVFRKSRKAFWGERIELSQRGKDGIGSGEWTSNCFASPVLCSFSGNDIPLILGTFPSWDSSKILQSSWLWLSGLGVDTYVQSNHRLSLVFFKPKTLNKYLSLSNGRNWRMKPRTLGSWVSDTGRMIWSEKEWGQYKEKSGTTEN